MPRKPKIQEFIETALGSSGKIQSIVLLMNRAVILLKEAKAEPAKRNANIVKTQNILAQLEMALNFREGELAGSLFFLFDFLFDELNRRDERAIDTAIRFLTELRATLNELRLKGN